MNPCYSNELSYLACTDQFPKFAASLLAQGILYKDIPHDQIPKYVQSREKPYTDGNYLMKACF